MGISKRYYWIANLLSLWGYIRYVLCLRASIWAHWKKQSGILAGSKSSRGDHDGGQRWSTNQSKPVASNLARGRRYCGSWTSKREEGECSDNSLAEQDHQEGYTETVTEHDQPKAGEHGARLRHRPSHSQGHRRRGTISTPSVVPVSALSRPFNVRQDVKFWVSMSAGIVAWMVSPQNFVS